MASYPVLWVEKPEAELPSIETDEPSCDGSAAPIVEQANIEKEEPSTDDGAQPAVDSINNEAEDIEDEEYAENNFSDSSSEFIEDPEPLDGYSQNDSIVEPFERPSAPEPTNVDYYDADHDFSDNDYAEVEAAVGEEEDTQPIACLPSPTAITATAATPFDEANKEVGDMQPRARLPPLPLMAITAITTTAPQTDSPTTTPITNHAPTHHYYIPTSRYRLRATPHSWTGLETTAWATECCIDHTTNTLDLYTARDARTGRLHGLLCRCTWSTHASREEVAKVVKAKRKEGKEVPVLARPAGIEIVVTTPEGEVWWLGEDETVYDEGEDLFDSRRREYGHRCEDDWCEAYFNYFGWWQYPEGGVVVTPEAFTEYIEFWGAVEAARASEAIGLAMETQYMRWTVVSYSGPTLEIIYEDQELVIEEAAGAPDCAVEGEDETDIEAETEAMDRLAALMQKSSDISQDNAMEQDRDSAETVRAAAVGVTTKRVEAAADVSEVSWWDRDPFSTSKMSWADIDELDDEPAPAEGTAAVDTVSQVEGAMDINAASQTDAEGITEAKVSFWDRDAFYISKMKWADMMEEDDELAPIEGVTEANNVSFWDRDPFYISDTNWADMMEEDDYLLMD